MLYGMPTLIELDTIDENLALCQKLGLDFIELNMNLPQFQAGELRRDIEKYRRITAQTGVFFTLHLDENLNFAEFNPLVREAYCQTAVEAIGIAKELQIPVVNLHMPAGVHFTLPEKKVYLFDAYRDDFMEAVRRFRDLCEGEVGGADVKICVENTDGYRAFQREAVEALLGSSCFALTWDIGHSHAAGERDEAFLLAHRDRMAHFHIHDARGKSNHLAFGTGGDRPARQAEDRRIARLPLRDRDKNRRRAAAIRRISEKLALKSDC